MLVLQISDASHRLDVAVRTRKEHAQGQVDFSGAKSVPP
jgi:hypothetical protein